MGCNVGEGGAFSKTPHGVVMAWMGDALEILKGHGIGWALWNVRGDFGVMDSGSADVAGMGNGGGGGWREVCWKC